jgi:phage terminase Nu1 subunit (DNA packaging protein)
MAQTKDKRVMVDTKTIALMFGLTVRRIQQLTQDGILETELVGKSRKYDRDKTTQTYITYLSDKASGRATAQSDQENESRKLAAEADLKEAKAAIEKTKLAELEGQMHRSEDVEAVITDLVFEIRSQITALPGRLAMDTARIQTAEEESIRIRDEVNIILDNLANYRYDPELFSKRVKARGEGADDYASEETDNS